MLFEAKFQRNFGLSDGDKALIETSRRWKILPPDRDAMSPSHIIERTIVRPVIQLSEVRKTYGKTLAVDGVSFEVYDGEIFGLIGPNGAGKTTTMECVEGLRTPDRGTITVLGLNPFREVSKLQNRIGVQLQQSQLQKRIKVWEAVDLWASLYRKRITDAERLLEQLGLADKRDTWFMNLSGGQKQRLFIALALINDPEVLFLILDDPSYGGGRAAVRSRSHHRARTDHRHRQPGEAHPPILS
jgi:ABC-type Na+ transport system ATPase subunit NatA